MLSPAAGVYKVCATGYAIANGVSTGFTLSSAVSVKGDTGGNLKASLPTKVYANGSASAILSWSGLGAGKRFLGAVQLLDPNGNMAATTAVSVDTSNPVPLATKAERALPVDRGL